MEQGITDAGNCATEICPRSPIGLEQDALLQMLGNAEQNLEALRTKLHTVIGSSKPNDEDKCDKKVELGIDCDLSDYIRGVFHRVRVMDDIISDLEYRCQL